MCCECMFKKEVSKGITVKKIQVNAEKVGHKNRVARVVIFTYDWKFPHHDVVDSSYWNINLDFILHDVSTLSTYIHFFNSIISPYSSKSGRKKWFYVSYKVWIRKRIGLEIVIHCRHVQMIKEAYRFYNMCNGMALFIFLILRKRDDRKING